MYIGKRCGHSTSGVMSKNNHNINHEKTFAGTRGGKARAAHKDTGDEDFLINGKICLCFKVLSAPCAPSFRSSPLVCALYADRRTRC